MKKILSILSVAALLMLSITLATAQTPKSVTIPLAAVSGSSVKGEAVLTEDAAGTKVVVSLTGYTAAQQSAGHIHTGKCDAQGPVFVSLSTITADAQGNGKAETVITPTLASLQTGNFYVQYHTAANPPGPQVSCGNIPAVAQATTAAATTAAATTAAATTAAATTAAATTAAATTAAATTTAAVTTTRAATTAAATTAAATTTRAATTAAGTVAPATSPRPGGQGGAPAGAPATGIGGGNQTDTNPAWFLLIGLLLVASGAGATYAVIRARK